MIGRLRNFIILAVISVLLPLHSYAFVNYSSICERSNVPQHMRGDNPAFDDYDFRIRNQGASGIINQIVNGVEDNVYANIGCIEACIWGEVGEAYDGSIGLFIDYANDISKLVTDISTTFIDGAIEEAKTRYNEIECTAQRIAGMTAGKTQLVEDAFDTANEIYDYYLGVEGIKTAAERAREVKRRLTGVGVVDEALNREIEEQHRILQERVNNLPELRRIHESQDDYMDAAGNLRIISKYVGEHTEKIASRMEEIQDVLQKINKALGKIQKEYCRIVLKDEKKTYPEPQELPLQNDMCDTKRIEENQYRACLRTIQSEVSASGKSYAQVKKPDDGCNFARQKWNQKQADDQCKAIVSQEIAQAGDTTPLEMKDDGCNAFRKAHNEGKDLDGQDRCIDPNSPQAENEGGSLPLGEDDEESIELDECIDPNLEKLLKLMQQLSRVAAALIVIEEVSELVEDVQKLQEYYDRVFELWKNILYVYQNANAAWNAAKAIYTAISALSSFNYASIIMLKNSMEDSWRVLQSFAQHACAIWKEQREFSKTAAELRGLGREIRGDVEALKNFDPNVKDIYAVYRMWRELRKEDRAENDANRPRADVPEESLIDKVDASQEELAKASESMSKTEDTVQEELSWWEKSYDVLENDIFSDDNIGFVRNLGTTADASATQAIGSIPRIADLTEDALDALWELEYEEVTCLAEGGEYTNLEAIFQLKRDRLDDLLAQIDQHRGAIDYHTQEIERISGELGSMSETEREQALIQIETHKTAIRLQVQQIEALQGDLQVLEQELSDVEYMMNNPDEFDVDRNIAFCNGDDSYTSGNPDVRHLRKQLERKAVYVCKVDHLVGPAANPSNTVPSGETSPTTDVSPTNPDSDTSPIPENSCIGNTGIFNGVGEAANQTLISADPSIAEDTYKEDSRFNCDANKADIYWRESAAIYKDMTMHALVVKDLHKAFKAFNIADIKQMVDSLEEMVEQIANIHNYIRQFEELRDMIQNIDEVLEQGLDNLQDAPKEILECLKLDPKALAEEMLNVVKDVIRDKISHELMYQFGYAGRDLAYMLLPDADYRPGDPLDRWLDDVIFSPPEGGDDEGDEDSPIGYYKTTTTPDEALAMLSGFESQLSDDAQQFLKDIITGQNQVYLDYMRKVGIDTEPSEFSTDEDYEIAAIFGSENASVVLEDDENWLKKATAQQAPDCEPDDIECYQRMSDELGEYYEDQIDDMMQNQSTILSNYSGSFEDPIAGEVLVRAEADPTSTDKINFYSIKNKGENKGKWNLSAVVDLSSVGENMKAFTKPNIKEILKLPKMDIDDGGPYTQKDFGDDFSGKLYFPTPLSWDKCGADILNTFCSYYMPMIVNIFGANVTWPAFSFLPACDTGMVYKEPVAHVEISPRENVSMLGNLGFLNIMDAGDKDFDLNIEGLLESKRFGTKWGSGGTNEGVMQARVWGISPIARSMSGLSPVLAPLTLACEIAAEREMDGDEWEFASVPFMPTPIIGAITGLTEPFLKMMKWRRDWFRPHAPMLGKLSYPLANLYTTEEDRTKWNPRIHSCGGVRADVSIGEDYDDYREHMGIPFDKTAIMQYGNDYINDPFSDDVCHKRPDQEDNEFVPHFMCASKCSVGAAANGEDRAANVCIGSWGALLPRNGHHINIDSANPFKAMALLAYRAFDRAMEYKYISPYKTAKDSGPYGKGYDQWWMSMEWPYSTKKFRVGDDFNHLISKGNKPEGFTGGMITTMWKETECCFRTCCDPHSWFPMYKIANAENLSGDIILKKGVNFSASLPGWIVQAEIMSLLASNEPWKVVNYAHVK